MMKNILKGMKRLMLTTAALCGVGLFLCAGEVKAGTPTASLTIERDGTTKNYNIVFHEGTENPSDSWSDSESKVVYTLSNLKINVTDGATPKQIAITPITQPNVKTAASATPARTTVVGTFNADQLIGMYDDSALDTLISGTGKFTVDAGADLVVEQVVGGTRSSVSSGAYDGSISSSSISSDKIYKVTVAKDLSETTAATAPTFTIKVSGAERKYGYKGDSFVVYAAGIEGYYHQAYMKQASDGTTATFPLWNNSNWKDAATATTESSPLLSGEIKDNATYAGVNSVLVAYFPKISDIAVSAVTNKVPTALYDNVSTVPAILHIKKSGNEEITVTYSLKAASASGTDDSFLASKLSTLGVLPQYTWDSSASEAIVNTTPFTNGNINVNNMVASYPSSGTVKFTFNTSSAATTNAAILVNGGDTAGTLACTFESFNGTPANKIESGKPGYIENPQQKTLATIYPYAELVDFSATKLNIAKGGNDSLVITGSPAGADWAKIFKAISDAPGTYIVATTSTPTEISYGTVSYSGNKLTIPFSVTSGAADSATKKYKITVKEKDVIIIDSKEVEISAETISAEKTKSAIKSQNQNYITVGYKLNVSELLKDCVKGTSDKNLSKYPTKVEITSGDSKANLSTDDSKFILEGKSAGVVKLKAYWGTGGTDPSISDIEVTVYPQPSAEFLTDSSNKNRIKVRIPAKISTGYKADKNIKEGTGFKLSMLNSSGDEIYSYDSSKFQNVVNSSDSKYKKETTKENDTVLSYYIYVPTSDVESMITTAGSNGKFSTSNETVSVVFKAAPMGVEATSSNTIEAKSEIGDKAKTSAQTVYRIKASGANFSDSFGWGLDGQTINLTAYPTSGYKFTKWEDGNTSNPRSITVSSSGTKNYGVLGEKTSANAAGGTGADNSGLYDDVPKTAENNASIWLIAFMVFAVIGIAYALYLQLKAATSRNGR